MPCGRHGCLVFRIDACTAFSIRKKRRPSSKPVFKFRVSCNRSEDWRPFADIFTGVWAAIVFLRTADDVTKLEIYPKDILHFCALLVAYWLPCWLVIISVVIYLYLSHRLIQNFYNRLQPILMDKPRFAFRWLDKALHLLGLLCMLWLFNDYLNFAVAFVLIGMAAKVMLISDSNRQQITPISDRYDAKEKSRRLKEAVAANRLYENPELTLTTLAVKLNIQPHDLSRIINVGMEKNFSDFINELRVRETARKMRDPAYNRLTLLGIAYESGFNSQRTFNRVFKEMTGKTPVEYKNCLKKELPNDKLAIPFHLPSIILRSGSPPSWAPLKLNRNYMFKNYFKIAWRNLWKYKGFTLINILGLSMGIAFTMLIGSYVWSELQVNRQLKNANNQYIILSKWKDPNMGLEFTSVAQLSRALKDEYPGLVVNSYNSTPVFTNVSNGNKHFREGIEIGDNTLLNMYGFKLLHGDAKSALHDSSAVVITTEAAKKYFGKTDVIGKFLTFEDLTGNKQNYIVSGVFDQLPENSITTALHKGADPAVVEKAIKDLLKSNSSNEIIQNLTPRLTPLTQYYLRANNGIIAKMIWTLSCIALFILLMAIINFVNIYIGRSSRRMKEIGVRKV